MADKNKDSTKLQSLGIFQNIRLLQRSLEPSQLVASEIELGAGQRMNGKQSSFQRKDADTFDKDLEGTSTKDKNLSLIQKDIRTYTLLNPTFSNKNKPVKSRVFL